MLATLLSKRQAAVSAVSVSCQSSFITIFCLKRRFFYKKIRGFSMSHPEKLHTHEQPVKILTQHHLKSVQQNVDTTVVTTPKPLSFSTAMKQQKKLVFPESDLEESLGVLSIRSGDLDSIDHQEERRRALNCLERASIMSTELPSRLLRPSGKSSICANGSLGDESTISETDLLEGFPQHNSTARQSDILSQHPITCKYLSQMSLGLRDSSKSIRDVLEDSRRFSMASEMFDSRASQKLAADELSWKQNFAEMPVEREEFPDDFSPKVSMSGFFQERCGDLTQLLGGHGSPEKKQQRPNALVDISDYGNYSSRYDQDVGLSLIQKVLADTNKTPGKALNCLLGKESCTFNKENIGRSISPEPSNKSVVSSRSTSSLSTLPNGKLPIESTKTELVWGNVKLGKNDIQEFTIRNKSSCRLKLQCKVSKPSFKLLKERPSSDLGEQIKKFTMRPFETRTIYVCFAPAIKGAAYDEVVFTPFDSHLEMSKKQAIKLWGYGGHGTVSIDNVSKQPYGKFWLPMGSLNKPKDPTISLKNTGTLASFAYLYFESKELYKFKNITIYPNRLVLQPNEQKEVVVRFSPSKEDLNFMKTTSTPVSELGLLKVVSGTEALRGRIRKLYKTVHSGKHELHNIPAQLSEAFPDECLPKDLCFINEPATYIQELVSMFANQEIGLTVEQDPDETLVNEVIQDTTMFHTLCHETTVYVAADHCNVEPNIIILTPPKKSEDVIFLESETDKAFEISCSPSRGLNVEPRKGSIKKGLPTLIRVSCERNSISLYKVMVNIETESFQVDVKIVPV